MKSVYQEYYERNKGYEVGLYAYSPPSDGMFNFDGVAYYCGKDFRTVEQYKIYKDCGFNILLGQIGAQYKGEEWETSKAKMVMDRSFEGGVKKMILLDSRIFDLSRTADGIIGEGKKFACEEELDEFIKQCIVPYKDHPAFYGLQLVDEPRFPLMRAIGQVYRSIKRVSPQTMVQCNLNPPFFIFASKMLEGDGDFPTRYKRYLNTFLDETGADYFQYDFYPFISEVNTSIYPMYFKGLRISAEVANERNVNFNIVMQSMAYRINCAPLYRTLDRADMFYQANALLGFAARHFSYFTYWSKGDCNINGEYFPDNLAIMTRLGEKTPLYDYVKEVNEMIQKLAPVIKDFEYVADEHNAKWPCVSRPGYLLQIDNVKPLKHVKYFSPDKEVVFINELYDKERGRYLYRIMNTTDPYYGKDTGEQTTEVQFDDTYRYADVFSNGEWKTVELEKGKYVAKLQPGFADYLILH